MTVASRPPRPHTPRRQAQEHREDADDGQRDQRHEAVLRAEEHRDRQDREQLPHRARGEQVAAETPAQQPVLPQDGQQRAQRRGGEAERRPARTPAPVRPPPAAATTPAASPTVMQPGHHGAPPGVLPEQPQVDLVAGEQEDEARARRRPAPGRCPGELTAEHVGPDEHAADQQQDHLRDGQPRRQPHDDRREQRDDEDGHQVVHGEVSAHPASGRSPPRGRDRAVAGALRTGDGVAVAAPMGHVLRKVWRPRGEVGTT